MHDPVFYFKPLRGQYTSGFAFMCGKWHVGTVSYNSVRAKGDPERWRATCSLPGIKADLGCFEEESDAAQILMKAVTAWFNRIDIVGGNND